MANCKRIPRNSKQYEQRKDTWLQSREIEQELLAQNDMVIFPENIKETT